MGLYILISVLGSGIGQAEQQAYEFPDRRYVI